MATDALTRRTIPTALALAIVFGLFAFSPNFRDHEGIHEGPYGGDFLQEWVGGYFVRSGERERFYAPTHAMTIEHDAQLMDHRWQAESYLPIVYPPFYYVLVSPLSALPYKTAAVVWAGLMTICLLASFRVMRSFGRVPRADAESAWIKYGAWLMPLAVLYSPLLESLGSGQKSTLLLLLFSATFLSLRQGRPFTAGCIFALVAFKPQLTLVVAFTMLFKRQWRFVLGGATMGGVLVALSFSVGSDVCRQYLEFSLGTGDYMANSGYDLHKSHCLFGFFALLLPGTTSILVKTLLVLSGAIVLLLLARQFRGQFDVQSTQFPRRFAALILATLLLSPHLFTYDLTLLLLAMYLLLPNTETERTSMRPANWLVLAGLFVLPSISVGMASGWGVQLTVPAMVGLLWMLARTEASTTVEARCPQSQLVAAK